MPLSDGVELPPPRPWAKRRACLGILHRSNHCRRHDDLELGVCINYFLLIPLLRLTSPVLAAEHSDRLLHHRARSTTTPRGQTHHGGDLQDDDFVAAAVQAALCAAPDSESRRQRPNANGAAAPIFIMAQGSLGDSPSLESLPIMA